MAQFGQKVRAYPHRTRFRFGVGRLGTFVLRFLDPIVKRAIALTQDVPTVTWGVADFWPRSPSPDEVMESPQHLPGSAGSKKLHHDGSVTNHALMSQ